MALDRLCLLLRSTALLQRDWSQGGWPEQYGQYRKHIKLHPAGPGVPLPQHRESWRSGQVREVWRVWVKMLAAAAPQQEHSFSHCPALLTTHPSHELLPSPISWLCVSKERRFAVCFGRHLHPILLWQIAHKVQSLSTFSLIPTQVFFQGWYQSWWLLSCWLQTQVPFLFLLCSLLSHGYQSKINYLQATGFAALFDFVRSLLFKGQAMLLYGHIPWTLILLRK